MLVWLFIASLWAADCPHGSDRFNCVKFVKNYDGDTITVNVPDVHPFFGKGLNVRLRGIDTPEIRGKTPCEKDWGRSAKKLVESELSHAKRIDLKINHKKKLDKYGRLLALVIYDNKDLAETLLKNHMAIRYDGGTKPKVDWCKEQAARLKMGSR